MNIPTIDLAQTGANIVTLRKAAGLTVADIQTFLHFMQRNNPMYLLPKDPGGDAYEVIKLVAGFQQ